MSERAASETGAGAGTVVGGLDVERVGGWLTREGGLRGPFRIEPVLGGRSNLTSIVTDADGRRVVVRRPPLSGVLASAHDVAREGRIMAALAGTAVPVPAVLAVDDGAAMDVPLLVTEHVEGTVVRDRATAAALDRDVRAGLAPVVARTLATLHAVDVDAVGLGDLARRDGYLARQLARWSGQLARGSDRALPELEEVARRLGAELPAQAGLALVHGDYRLDNLIVAPDGSHVRAVLDWELATLGDPLADLGTLLAYWGVPAAGGAAASVLHPELPTALDGFGTPGELVAAYGDAAGLEHDDLAERLRPYLAFAWFRIACILEGVRVRTAAGAYGVTSTDEAGGAEQALLVTLVPALGERALALLSRRGPVGFDHELT